MTEEEFFNTHQIAYRGNNNVYQFIVVNLENGNTKRYNFDKSKIDTVLFEFYTGRSFDDEVIEIVANEIRRDFNIEYDGDQN